MTVDTKKVAQRREVHYDSCDDLLADAERFDGGEPGIASRSDRALPD